MEAWGEKKSLLYGEALNHGYAGRYKEAIACLKTIINSPKNYEKKIYPELMLRWQICIK